MPDLGGDIDAFLPPAEPDTAVAPEHAPTPASAPRPQTPAGTGGSHPALPALDLDFDDAPEPRCAYSREIHTRVSVGAPCHSCKKVVRQQVINGWPRFHRGLTCQCCGMGSVRNSAFHGVPGCSISDIIVFELCAWSKDTHADLMRAQL